MTRVYAIHTGSYSDQSWGPVFSTVEKALAYKEASEATEIDIEIHVLDEEKDSLCYPVYRMTFDAAGNVVWHEKAEAEPYEPNLHRPEVARVPPDAGWYFLKNPRVETLLVRNVRAPDLDHAVKIAADARRQFLALGSGKE